MDVPYFIWECALFNPECAFLKSVNVLNLKIKTAPKLESNTLILSLCKLLSLLSSAEVLMYKWAQEMFDFIPKLQLCRNPSLAE